METEKIAVNESEASLLEHLKLVIIVNVVLLNKIVVFMHYRSTDTHIISSDVKVDSYESRNNKRAFSPNPLASKRPDTVSLQHYLIHCS